MSLDHKVAHIFLVGPLITDDWDLIRNLRSRYLVTLMERVEFLNQYHRLPETKLLIMDCSQDSQHTLASLPKLKKRHSKLCILLVDGGLSQKQIAQAFEEGVKDYFATPYHLDLLIERIDSLCEPAKLAKPPGC